MNIENVSKENNIMVAVVQSQDVEGAELALGDLGLSVTKLPSMGGFLGRRNATLFIGIPPEKENAALHALQKSCRKRVEYIAVPLESAPLPLPTPTPITIGGATIFALEVEHFEVI